MKEVWSGGEKLSNTKAMFPSPRLYDPLLRLHSAPISPLEGPPGIPSPRDFLIPPRPLPLPHLRTDDSSSWTPRDGSPETFPYPHALYLSTSPSS